MNCSICGRKISSRCLEINGDDVCPKCIKEDADLNALNNLLTEVIEDEDKRKT